MRLRRAALREATNGLLCARQPTASIPAEMSMTCSPSLANTTFPHCGVIYWRKEDGTAAGDTPQTPRVISKGPSQ
ncbi:hypothetical protein AAFF_G00255560 [Aldrovandia affinis]|uniref:Uncharacterized protein n=1 Tax=Aldrovandia affinis TaxID=143900 RepID=A0AAD7RCW1_9TELE|nr:hypothetical protein AAFF_G00255560 [Aldrovandia affinis]